MPAEHEASVNSADPDVDLDALVCAGRKLHCNKGKGMTEDNVLAFKLFLRAAEAGNVQAQYYLGLCYLNGDGVPQDITKGTNWLEQSARGGFAQAMLFLGAQYLTGRCFLKDEEQAIKWFQNAADAGSRAACELLTGIYRDRRDAAEELRWNKEAALRGCFDSLWSVRTCYELNAGEKIDLVEAYAWLSLYEDDFTSRKLSRELWSFQLGPGVSKCETCSLDLLAITSTAEFEAGKQRYRECVERRVRWITRNAEAGSATAQYDLSWCYREGYGVLSDHAETMRWLQMAAKNGNALAQKDLG